MKIAVENDTSCRNPTEGENFLPVGKYEENYLIYTPMTLLAARVSRA
jgi:hypothetical protein